jgi:sugar O-acyltransferase (sialic acid O-acetyltransferase NeuD family)
VANIVLVGAGDIARLAHFYFATDSEHQVVGFTVDAEFCSGDTFLDLPLVPLDQVASRYPPTSHRMFVALSYARMNRVRAEKYRQVKALGYDLVSYVSSRCSFLSQRPPGDNCFILEDNTIQPFVTIGCNVTLWSGNHIGHDSVIGDHCFVSSHVVVSGHVTVGESCFIGVNATLRDSIRIGERTLIGAGSLVTRDTPPGSVYLGARAERAARTSDDVDL